MGPGTAVILAALLTGGGPDRGLIPTTPAILTVDPAVVDPAGGSRVRVLGPGIGRAAGVRIGGIPATGLRALSDDELEVVSGPVAAARALDVEVSGERWRVLLQGAVESWSPAEIEGARLFDALSGVESEEAATLYEWQRLTSDIGPGWRARDGTTTTWLPSTGRFWMVAGWNPFPAPKGFDEITTDEVWSSPDGVTWDRELDHLNGAFERRHVHNTVVWKDRLWMIGGDAWQGYHNHDVVSSADGVHWTLELAPGTPPWTPRALQISGVYGGKLWTGGGQDLLGDPTAYVYHNDLWNSDDGVHWTLVAADGPGSGTRWAGCGMVDGFVEFKGRMWLVGCARYRNDTVMSTMSNEVWSTADGVTWTRHADPPWVGKGWANVVVWDGKLWILFGYTYGDPANGWPAGNSNEAWSSEDGETWQALPPDAPVPGSHAQGVAVADGFLLLAGGNHTFGTIEVPDKSVWRLVPWRGEAVHSWTDRGRDALCVTAPSAAARPIRVADAFGEGAPGLQFDGSRTVLSLPDPAGDAQAEGRSVFWVGRAPYLPSPWGWEDTYAPVATVVGGPVGPGLPVSSVGLTEGRIVLRNLNDAPGEWGEAVYSRFAAGGGLQEGPGTTRLAGVTHAPDGTVTAWVDGEPAGTGRADYGSPRVWTQIGGGMDDWYYGPHSRFAGTLGAVIVIPRAVDRATVERIHAWARGRFGVPQRRHALPLSPP